jgi:hypothetical protein
MGTWSGEPFGSDGACDWSYDLIAGRDLSALDEALDRVIEADDYVDGSDGEEAVAAAEVVAKLLGRGTQTDAYTEDVDIWVASVAAAPSSDLIGKAVRALDLIVGDQSELAELWDEGHDSDEWRSRIARLRAALAA